MSRTIWPGSRPRPWWPPALVASTLGGCGLGGSGLGLRAGSCRSSVPKRLNWYLRKLAYFVGEAHSSTRNPKPQRERMVGFVWSVGFVWAEPKIHRKNPIGLNLSGFVWSVFFLVRNIKHFFPFLFFLFFFPFFSLSLSLSLFLFLYLECVLFLFRVLYHLFACAISAFCVRYIFLNVLYYLCVCAVSSFCGCCIIFLRVLYHLFAGAKTFFLLGRWVHHCVAIVSYNLDCVPSFFCVCCIIHFLHDIYFLKSTRCIFSLKSYHCDCADLPTFFYARTCERIFLRNVYQNHASSSLLVFARIVLTFLEACAK